MHSRSWLTPPSLASFPELLPFSGEGGYTRGPRQRHHHRQPGGRGGTLSTPSGGFCGPDGGRSQGIGVHVRGGLGKVGTSVIPALHCQPCEPGQELGLAEPRVSNVGC